MMSLPPHDVSRLAKEWFDRWSAGMFENILLRCTSFGIIIKNPTQFLMAEPCWSDGKQVSYEGVGEPNCWFVHWLSGSGVKPASYMASADRPLEYIGYERGRKVKIFKWETGIRHGN